MRKQGKSLVQHWLKSIATSIIKKYQPFVIGVTGSFGKTSTKNAIYAALGGKLASTRKTEGNLNAEFGLPLTIIGASDPKGSALKYLQALLRGFSLLIKRDRKYPTHLVLEMGANKPGDLAYLLDIVRPQIAVLTGIGETHLDLLGSVEQVAREKARLIEALPEGGVAIINYDNEHSRQIGEQHQGRVLSYGLHDNADLQAVQVRFELHDLPEEQPPLLPSLGKGGLGGVIGGTSFRVETAGGSVGVAYLKDALGAGYIYSTLAALAVTKALNADLGEAIKRLRDSFEPSKGRLRLLKGIKRTILIDDSYNSSPQAAIMALETLANLAVRGRKWAVLGDMLELGTSSQELHRKVGARVAELGIDYLITSGDPANEIAHGALKAGKSEDTVFEFANKATAGRFLQERMQEGDLILIKGSRGIHQETHGTRLEKIIKEVMAEPRRADELLVS